MNVLYVCIGLTWLTISTDCCGDTTYGLEEFSTVNLRKANSILKLGKLSNSHMSTYI